MNTTPEISSNQVPDSDAQSVLTNPGQFELPIPHPVAANESGAIFADWNEQDEADAERHEEFPMIVWLRGDEPWFSSFDMDADAVMKTLGIKRSRLTQIAGKDLRVGRVRVDRYIRPVFRSSDVQQYLNWTRATASHQKSSDAIKLAVDGLQKQSSLIQDTLNQISSAFTAEIKSELKEFISESVDAGVQPASDKIASLSSQVKSSIQFFESQINSVSLRFSESAQQLTETVSMLQKNQQAAFELMTLQLNLTSEKVAIMEERLTAWDTLLVENMAIIRDQIKELKRPQTFAKSVSRKVKVSKTDSKAEKPLLRLRAAPKKRRS